jgi:hypothetical protein
MRGPGFLFDARGIGHKGNEVIPASNDDRLKDLRAAPALAGMTLDPPRKERSPL